MIPDQSIITVCSDLFYREINISHLAYVSDIKAQNQVSSERFKQLFSAVCSHLDPLIVSNFNNIVFENYIQLEVSNLVSKLNYLMSLFIQFSMNNPEFFNEFTFRQLIIYMNQEDSIAQFSILLQSFGKTMNWKEFGVQLQKRYQKINHDQINFLIRMFSINNLIDIQKFVQKTKKYNLVSFEKFQRKLNRFDKKDNTTSTKMYKLYLKPQIETSPEANKLKEEVRYLVEKSINIGPFILSNIPDPFQIFNIIPKKPKGKLAKELTVKSIADYLKDLLPNISSDEIQDYFNLISPKGIVNIYNFSKLLNLTITDKVTQMISNSIKAVKAKENDFLNKNQIKPIEPIKAYNLNLNLKQNQQLNEIEKKMPNKKYQNPFKNQGNKDLKKLNYPQIMKKIVSALEKSGKPIDTFLVSHKINVNSTLDILRFTHELNSAFSLPYEEGRTVANHLCVSRNVSWQKFILEVNKIVSPTKIVPISFDIDKILENFENLEFEDDGQITKEDFERVMSIENVHALISLLDQNQTGFISLKKIFEIVFKDRTVPTESMLLPLAQYLHKNDTSFISFFNNQYLLFNDYVFLNEYLEKMAPISELKKWEKLYLYDLYCDENGIDINSLSNDLMRFTKSSLEENKIFEHKAILDIGVQKLIDYFKSDISLKAFISDIQNFKTCYLTLFEVIQKFSRLKIGLSPQEINKMVKKIDRQNKDIVLKEELIKFVQDLSPKIPKRIKKTTTEQVKEGKQEISLYEIINEIKKEIKEKNLESIFIEFYNNNFCNSNNNVKPWDLAKYLSTYVENAENLLIVIQSFDKNSNNYLEEPEYINFAKNLDINIESKLLSSIKKSYFHHLDIGKKRDTDKFEISQMIIKNFDKSHKFDSDLNYFRNCKTILNGMESALKKCQEIYDSLKEGEKFFDKDFGSQPDSDDGNKFSLYWNGNSPQNYPQPDDIVWLKPKDICEEGTNPKFIDQSLNFNDVRQGELGDCWFIGALSVIALHDEKLQGFSHFNELKGRSLSPEMAAKLRQGVFPSIFAGYSQKGIYCFRFYKNGFWRYVIIDHRIPCRKNTNKPVFATSRSPNELWVTLIEKAYAKLHGCYESLISGNIDEALSDMTGLPIERFNLQDKNGNFPSNEITDADDFWEIIKNNSANGSLTGCSIHSNTSEGGIFRYNGIPTGLFLDHAYSIIDVLELPTNKSQKGKKFSRLLRLRNPHGTGEWTGKWSDGSEEIEKYKDLIEKYNNNLPPEDQIAINEDDGAFLISFCDWRNIFSNLYICKELAENWKGIFFSYKWDSHNAKGTPIVQNEVNFLNYASNPQFIIESRSTIELLINLSQNDGRFEKNSKYPFEGIIHSTFLCVFKLENNMKMLDKFQKELITAKSPIRSSRDNYLRLKIDKGRYVLIPSTQKVDCFGNFQLSIFYSNPNVSFYCASDKECIGKSSNELLGEETQITSFESEVLKNVYQKIGYKTQMFSEKATIIKK